VPDGHDPVERGGVNAPADVLVVGASAAGLGTVEALRRKGYPGPVTILGAEPHPPYDRPPLSKQVLSGAWDPGRTHLRPTAELDALDAEFVLGDPAVALDAATRTVHTRSGRVWQAEAVVLATGEVLPAQVVVVAIGAVPQTEWLADRGLRLDNGVVCDSYCRAADGIYAVGDVARWQHETLGALVRLENRTNAAEQAGAVAANLLGENRPYVPVPYFWTDQFNAKIQVHGVLSPDAEVSIVDGAEEDRRFVALYRRHGNAIGVLGWNMPKQARLHRQALSL
jgi:NADPH-dependent 2,4-dienoyl-CoA reductase/sulfur reductase-like enzyme